MENHYVETRKLATVETIIGKTPIPNSDNIELITLRGWNVVVKRETYNIGDSCVYCEIDSIIPEKILKKYGFWDVERNVGLLNGKEGNRVKTKKIRGALSQGIVLPVKILDDDDVLVASESRVENNVTNILGIQKYNPPEPAVLGGNISGGFPSWIKKTDETRIQNSPEYLTNYADVPFYVTQKIDGSSCTIYLKDDKFGVCSRNFELDESPTNSFWKMVRDLNIEERLRKYGKNIVIQGEMFGPGIQKNKENISKVSFAVFNVILPDTNEHADYDKFVSIVSELGLNTVPVIETNYYLPKTLPEILTFAEGKSVINPQAEREGLVFRPMVPIIDQLTNDRLSFKVISNKFLLKHED